MRQVGLVAAVVAVAATIVIATVIGAAAVACRHRWRRGEQSSP